MDLLLSGGPVLVIILVISLYALYVFFERLLKLSKERLEADALMIKVAGALRDRNLDLALLACENHGGPVARVLHGALSRLPYGKAAVEAGFQEASIEEEQNLTRGLRALSTIAQIAPLLGLLGTVTGMIIAFNQISVTGVGNASTLAGGIGQALVTTAAGLIVAIPALIGHNYLSSKVDRIFSEIDKRREELMGMVAQIASRQGAKQAPESPSYETVPAS
jgi:biopolymer transport protein ExbB